MQRQRTYIAIDLKSFYASVKGLIRKVDHSERSLIMADGSRIPFEHIADLDSEIFDE